VDSSLKCNFGRGVKRQTAVAPGAGAHGVVFCGIAVIDVPQEK